MIPFRRGQDVEHDSVDVGVSSNGVRGEVALVSRTDVREEDPQW